MSKLIINDEAKNLIKKILYRKEPMVKMMSVSERKKLINDTIGQGIEKKLEDNLDNNLYRGVVIEDTGIDYSEEGLKALSEQINVYKTGSYSMDISIAEAYSKCGSDCNLDYDYENYFSIVFKFVSGDYVNIHELLEENWEEKYYIREKEYYCFPKEITIEKFEYVGSNPMGKLIAEVLNRFYKNQKKAR